jgi:hypothetical protein
MDVSIEKYGLSISFCPELVIFCQIVGYHLWILSKKLLFLKPVKTHIRDRYI